MIIELVKYVLRTRGIDYCTLRMTTSSKVAPVFQSFDTDKKLTSIIWINKEKQLELVTDEKLMLQTWMTFQQFLRSHEIDYKTAIVT